jgi:hypothetical protein
MILPKTILYPNPNIMFCKDLIQKIQIYFSHTYNIRLDNKQAEEFLNSLADLYLAFYQIQTNKHKNK